MRNTLKSCFIVIALLGLNHWLTAQNDVAIDFTGSSPVWKKGEHNLYLSNVNLGRTGLIPKNVKQKVNVFAEKYFKTNPKKQDHPYFIIPVQLAEGINDPGFYSITAYFDHDSLFPGQLLDFACGDLTYDLQDGYNHEGTDFFPWPFPWMKMHEDQFEIIAAADGVIAFKQDGNFDEHCEANNDPWNGIGILHNDGSTSWYIHLKKNSLTGKVAGSPVEQGEYLGIVGSSGSSVLPHLHFEVYDTGGKLFDPFYGSCNQTIEESWWVDQPGYKEAGINKISTNNHLPVFSECQDVEILNEKQFFYPGDSIYFLTYFRNISTSDTLRITIKRPDNSIFDDWIWISSWDFYTTSWLYFFTILNNEQFGYWKYIINFKGESYAHVFQLLDPQAINEFNNPSFKVFPNPVYNEINVQSDYLKISSISLISPFGNTLFRNHVNLGAGELNHFSTSGLPKGLYFLQIESGERIFRKKIIKL
ncbi:MAG: peptidoglycan DD-metalloendopeptidase family protein [Bacteroidales bacterium]|nr:peptidoglycan DD-metalloendopeptidase family protein [Bacteroidales bacterium]